MFGKNENGERSDGDFEEPSEEDFADTTTDGGCPYCGQNLTNAAVCKHFVGSLGDDDAGGDTVTPLYFGWTEHHDESHDNMIECLDGYFEALCGLCDQIVKAGADEAKRMRSEAKRLPPAERAILTQAVQLLDHLGGSEDYETPQELLRGELPSQLKTFFTELFRQARGKPMATDWIIRGACCGPAHIIGRKMPGNVSGASFKKAGRQLTAYRSLSKRASVR